MSEAELSTACVLAGGKGTRLQSVVSDRQKVVAPSGERPFVARVLDQLHDAGVKRAVLCVGHLAQTVVDVLGRNWKGMELVYSTESEPLGTGGAVLNALGLMRDGTILVMNGDSFCKHDLRKWLRTHAEQHWRTSMLVTRVDDVRRFGAVVIDHKDEVMSLSEKSGSGAGWINAGAYLFSSDDLRSLGKPRVLSLERDVLPLWMARGIHAWKAEGPFVDIGLPETYAHAEEILRG